MSSLMQRSEDFEQFRKILSDEVHNAVKSAVSDLPSVVYQSLLKLSPIFDQGIPRASSSGVIPTSVPKCRSINTKQISNPKLKCFDDKSKEDADLTTENLPLSNLRFVRVDSARSVSDTNTSIVSSYCPSSRRSSSRFITIAQDKSSLKRRKIPMLPSTEFSGLWCYQKRRQRWIMVSKYGRNICRNCFAPVHQQKRNCTDSNTSLPNQCSQMGPLKEDKATNTNAPTNTFSKIPISVSKVTEEIMKRRNLSKSGSDSKDAKSPSNCGSMQLSSELSCVSLCKQQAHIGVQTDYNRRDVSSQTTISSKPECVEHSVQTYKNEKIPRVTQNTSLLTTRSYLSREKEKAKKSPYFLDKFPLV